MEIIIFESVVVNVLLSRAHLYSAIAIAGGQAAILQTAEMCFECFLVAKTRARSSVNHRAVTNKRFY